MSYQQTIRSPDQSMSEAVVSRIAARKGVAPCELEPRLYDAIDPEALESVFRETTGQITFEYCDFLVTVDSDGTVELLDPPR